MIAENILRMTNNRRYEIQIYNSNPYCYFILEYASDLSQFLAFTGSLVLIKIDYRNRVARI